jgi:hypothetical protein
MYGCTKLRLSEKIRGQTDRETETRTRMGAKKKKKRGKPQEVVHTRERGTR